MKSIKIFSRIVGANLQNLYLLAMGYPKLPVIAGVEVLNFCNLRCPLCPTGAYPTEDPQAMSFDRFKSMMDRLVSIKALSFFNWTEPLLNPEICRMLHYAVSLNIFTIAFSNLSMVKSDEFFCELVNSGLHKLGVSIDGACKSTYNAYKKHGDFDLVISNVKKLVAIKKRYNKSYPVIELRFILNKLNIAEVDKAKNLARDLGVDINFTELTLDGSVPRFDTPQVMQVLGQQWVAGREELNRLGKDLTPPYRCDREAICPFLCDTIYFNYDGSVVPCCYALVKDNGHSFGNINTQSLAKIWCGNKYINARNRYKKTRQNYRKEPVLCDSCTKFKPLDS